MEGRGSELCDHVVKEVIKHVNEAIEPRMKALKEFAEDVIYDPNLSADYKICKHCNIPITAVSETIIYCKQRHDCYNCRTQELCNCMVSCGQNWCNPLSCDICGKQNMCNGMIYRCDEENCNKIICASCIGKKMCNHCLNDWWCLEHQEKSFKPYVWSCVSQQCYYQDLMCSRCLKYEKGIIFDIYAPCYKCKKNYRRLDMSVIKENGHSEKCGQPVCKNCNF